MFYTHSVVCIVSSHEFTISDVGEIPWVITVQPTELQSFFKFSLKNAYVTIYHQQNEEKKKKDYQHAPSFFHGAPNPFLSIMEHLDMIPVYNCSCAIIRNKTLNNLKTIKIYFRTKKKENSHKKPFINTHFDTCSWSIVTPVTTFVENLNLQTSWDENWLNCYRALTPSNYKWGFSSMSILYNSMAHQRYECFVFF